MRDSNPYIILLILFSLFNQGMVLAQIKPDRVLQTVDSEKNKDNIFLKDEPNDKKMFNPNTDENGDLLTQNPELSRELRKESLPVDTSNFIKIELGSKDDIKNINDWYGTNEYNGKPPDNEIAVGEGKLIQVTNARFFVYSTTTNLQQLDWITLQDFFGFSSANLFDPRTVFDKFNHRWVILATDTLGNIHIASSKTSNPLPLNPTNWRFIYLDLYTNGYFIDYPTLGFSYPTNGTSLDGSIVISGNVYSQSPSVYQRSEVYVLRSSDLYTSTQFSYNTFNTLFDEDNSKSITIQPSRQISRTPNSALYLLNTKFLGDNKITIRKINNANTSDPTIEGRVTIPVSDYHYPPLVNFSGQTFDPGSCRCQVSHFLNGYIYAVWTTKRNLGAGDRTCGYYVRINTSNNSIENQRTFGFSNPNNYHLVNPSVIPEVKYPYNSGRAAFCYSFGGEDLYASAGINYFEPPNFLNPNAYVFYGEGPLNNMNNRIGDYSGITFDDSEDGTFWACSEIGRTYWGSRIFHFRLTSVGILSINSEVPNNYSLKQNYPNPFNPNTKISFSIPKSDNIKLIVYDLLGREVKRVIDEHLSVGTYSFDFDGSNLSSGIYLYKIITTDYSETKQMILNK